ncbi:NAD(P)/FAD-dependent oxidoreductase [Rhodopseudomonas sp. RCAM05734]|uniref:NAD(P)/FAD-dependent oxidoreductase n=1 Tax=Rhodopseudomonas sp. RCAM05734 TaxID=3457549 RepID=UPI004044499A
MARVVVLGAGAMGLAAAYHALKLGHDVTLLEAGPQPGGMAAHFDFGGLSLERYYHFVCKADRPTFELMDELGIGDRMRWVGTSMGYYVDGKLYPWGDPVSLLTFPKLSLIEKLRYGMMMFVQTKRRDWSTLENVSAKTWIERWCGATVYRKLWKPLFDLKFYEYADNVSAAWIWTRIKRVGNSRRSLFQEEMGYIDGGSDTLVRALVTEIERMGGRIELGCPADEVLSEAGRVVGVVAGGRTFAADAVISTVPTPQVARLVPSLPDEWKAKYDAIENIGVICVVFKLRRSVTPHFWVNIIDPNFEIPGIIEFSNLRPTGDTIVYVPYYMPTTQPKWSMDDAYFRQEAFGYLKRLNPAITDDDFIDMHVGRLRHAQPVCPPGFLSIIPPVETPIAGLQVADTCFYYPEDRGIAESVRFGAEMARRIA